MCVCHKACNPLAKPFDKRYKSGNREFISLALVEDIALCDPGAEPRLRDLEYEEHYYRKDRNTEPLVSKDRVDLILRVFISCEDLAAFNILDDLIYKVKALSVSRFYYLFVREINVALNVRGGLTLADDRNCLGDNFLESVTRGGYGFNNGTVELLGERFYVDLGLLLFICVGLVKSNYDGNTELKQLCCEEQATA